MSDTVDSTDVEVIVLDEEPRLTRLYAGAVAPGGSKGDGSLPTRHLRREGVVIDREHVAEYAAVCGFRLTDALPPTFLHMLAFPIQIALMSGDGFPFPLLGMVHLRQRVDLHRPVTADEQVDVEVWLEHLRPHEKGQQFTVRSRVEVEGAVVWDGTSTYLHRGGAGDVAAEEHHAADEVDVASLPMTSLWTVPADIGRKYGAVSGDRNPIHLSAVSAKPFGFPSAIAHGMWTMAHALAGLEGRVPAAASIDVAFKTPLHLPGKVTYATTALQGGAWAFGVRNDRNGKPHLAGIVRPADA